MNSLFFSLLEGLLLDKILLFSKTLFAGKLFASIGFPPYLAF
jgi:hypothetical protein